MDFLELANKSYLVFGVANRKSVAYAIGRSLEQCGARVAYVVRDEQQRAKVCKVLPETDIADIFVCDVEHDDQMAALQNDVATRWEHFDGLVHSIAFADYEGEVRPFHQTKKEQFLRAIDISCFSLTSLSNAFRDMLSETASVVTISISTTRMASESYGFMAPVKAALDSSLAFLTKSFSAFSQVRFNAVSSGLLKTSASAGIPGYVDAYLYAEQVIPRKRALATQEVANVALFLLSPRSSGITAQTVVVDAGMSINYFDTDLVRRAMDAPSA